MGRLGLVIALFGMLVAAWAGPVRAGEAVPAALGQGTMLVMIETPDCPYCKKWEREVGPGYRASDEGKMAPLVKRMKGHADLAGIRGVAYSPTFILFDRGSEIGRIIGYAGADFFWGELGRLMSQANLRPGGNNANRAALPHDPPQPVVR